MSLANGALSLAVGATTFTATEVATDAASEVDLVSAAKAVLSAVMDGKGWLAAALALVLVTAALRRYGGRWLPFLKSDTGGMMLVLVGSFAGACATALAAGAAISAGLLWTALGVAVAAMGGYVGLAKGLLPLLDKAAERWPVLTPAVAMLRWLLNRPTAVAKAEKAGADAVAAKPGGGLDAVVGAEDVLK